MTPENGTSAAQSATMSNRKRVGTPPRRYASIQDLVQVGLLELPLEMRGKRDGQIRMGRITEDAIPVWNGRSYTSLSAAAGDALASIVGMSNGNYPSVNGWDFWEFLDTNGLWEPLHTLRERYQSRNALFDTIRKGQ